MSMAFTKLFSSITESTVWCEPDGTRLVWITMLAMADKRGRIWASIPGLANRARVPMAATEIAITCFLSPDPYSRTEGNDGRRIEKIDGGWRLINYDKYRDVRDEEDQASRKAANQAAYRDRKKRPESDRELPVVTASDLNAEAEAEAEAVKQSTLALTSDEVRPAGVFHLPMIGTGEWEVPQKLYDELVLAYPGVSVMFELGKMRTWLITHPENRKKQLPKFINSWLSKAQDKSSPGGNSGNSQNRFSKPDKISQTTQNAAAVITRLRANRPRSDEDGVLAGDGSPGDLPGRLLEGASRGG